VRDYSVLGQDETGRPTFVDLHIGDQEVFLMERPDYRPPAQRNERGLNHICLTIDSTDPDQLQANLRARGVPIRGTRAGRNRDGRPTFSVYIDDPDGHGVELEQVVAQR
jgi:catechol 2,3-dioxygenase-like lactoylglutathione lyase family enzyme